jgi:DNA-binding transcriptional LysR family regulator
MKIETKFRAESLSMQQVYSFCAVFEQGGYAGAAEILGLSGPTIWEQIKGLERIYAAKLFARSGRSVQPTQAAEVLYGLLSQVKATVESSIDVIDAADETKPRAIRIVAGVRMIQEELGSALASFRSKHPNVMLKLMTADNREAQQLLLHDHADLALMIEPPADLLASGIEIQSLYAIEYLAALPRRHPLAKKADFLIKDLIDEPLILGNKNTVGRRMLEDAFFRQGFRQSLNIVAETDNSAITLACVRAGMGIGILAGISTGVLTKALTTKSMSKELGLVHVAVAKRTGRVFPSFVDDMLAALRDTLQHVVKSHK